MKGESRSVIVVGAGIVGLTSAYRLARRGHHVTLIDPRPGRGATWAAAGMIAPSAEILPGEQETYRLQLGALPAWRGLVEDLEELTGIRVGVYETGTLYVGWEPGDRALLRQFTEVADSFAAPFRHSHRIDEPALFSGLSDRVNDGVVLAGDAWVDPDEAVRVLREALSRLDVELVTESVVEVSGDERSVIAHTPSRRVSADTGLLTTGCSALPLGSHASGLNLVRPVRGVTVRVQGLETTDSAMVRAFVRGHPFYLVNRSGGRGVLGASSEERSAAAVEVGELHRILRDALELVPSLESAEILETRVGLRPASPTGRPFFERLEPKGWGWSSGYYRHGVTLAPWAADLAVAFVEEL
ncbi:MAG TPA: FAD-dependent oxidoreductase [Acidimicrobiales bacterium]|nr:FAD-dependent oxidoreductase [Acidimicrobiales bacterium]